MILASRGRLGLVVLFWLLAAATVPVWIYADHVGWDAGVYEQTIASLQVGHDPYADDIARQADYQREEQLHPESHGGQVVPFSYLYSPITLPLLRAAGLLPRWLRDLGYWLLYVAGALAMVWVGMSMAEDRERELLRFAAPAALFFPGLLNHDSMLSGNVAFVLYGLLLVCALRGWRHGRWECFYAAVLLASCVKAPLLSFLAIPVVSARRQWACAGIVAAIGVGLFLGQMHLWPQLFHSYLQTLRSQYSYSREFGSSPAGVLSLVESYRGVSNPAASAVFYGLYAVAVFAALCVLGRQRQRGAITLEHWMPVALVGTILLNPRIMQYDSVPLTLPLGLIGWRFLARFLPPGKAALWMGVGVAIANCIAFISDDVWKWVECVVLVGLFVVGCWSLSREARVLRDDSAERIAVG